TAKVMLDPLRRWLVTSHKGKTVLWDLLYKEKSISDVGGFLGFFRNRETVELGLQEEKYSYMGQSMQDMAGEIRTITADAQSDWLYTVSGDDSGDEIVQRWNLKEKKPALMSGRMPVQKDNKDKITVVAIDPQNRWLVTGNRDGIVRLWDLK